MLPDIDGSAFMMEVPSRREADDVPILVLTGRASEVRTAGPTGGQLMGGCVKAMLCKGEFATNDPQDAVRSAVGS